MNGRAADDFRRGMRGRHRGAGGAPMTRSEKIRQLVATHLEELERVFQAPYRLTFIARHPDRPGVDVVVTSDPDLEALITTVRGLAADEKALVYQGTEEPAP